MAIATPYYLIDEQKLQRNLEIIKRVRETSGAKSLLALKCFSTWSVFGLMSRYMDGTTSSSLYEVRLGREKFGGCVHAYSVAWSKSEIAQLKKHADTVIFNSTSQLKKFYPHVKGMNVGVRVNPGFSYSHFDLADPSRRHSRLGIAGKDELAKVIRMINGCMFHFNCENNDFDNLSLNLDRIAGEYKDMLGKLEWVSLGGGIYFTKKGYPVEKLCRKLKEFGTKFDIQVYLEPGESSITQSAQLVTTVLDIVHNGADIAIVDASIEAHMLDLLTYRLEAKIDGTGKGRYTYIVAGRSCLAGDVFGTYRFSKPLKAGSTVRFADAAGYTMVKKNWFNGLPMPSIVVKRIDGTLEEVRRFDYDHYITSLS